MNTEFGPKEQVSSPPREPLSVPFWSAFGLMAVSFMVGAGMEWSYLQSRTCELVDTKTMCIHDDKVYEVRRIGGTP